MREPRRSEPGRTHEAVDARTALPWLIRLRWGVIVGELAVLAVARAVAALPIPVGPVAALLAGFAISNGVLARSARSARPPGQRIVAAVVTVDIGALTGLLVLTGGASNPLSALYLVYVALAALVLGVVGRWLVVGLTMAAYAAVFFAEHPLAGAHAHAHHHHHGVTDNSVSLHLRGMWLAHALASTLIASVVGRLAGALRERDRALAAGREREARLGALTTLAAGAAHELATPLGTIAVVAGELRDAVSGDDARADLALVQSELARCRAILDRMALRGAAGHELARERVAVSDLVTRAVQSLRPSDATRVDTRPSPDDALHHVTVAPGPAAQALAVLLQNALEAGPGRVGVTRVAHAGLIGVQVADEGPGIPPDVLARLGEPFFTTKPAGRGMGLGLFVARHTAEAMGGRVELSSSEGGTRATLWLPEAA